jgi:hypothetical protein
VVKGLTAEDRVIVNGLMMIRPGAKVEVQVAKAEGESPKSEVQSPKSKVDGKKAAVGTEPQPESKP